MLRRIKIVDARGRVGVTVWAWVDGNLAVHKAYNGAGVFARGDAWTITHVPTGAAVGLGDVLRRDVPKRLRAARKIRWHKVNPLDMPVCELASLLPTIAKDLQYKYGDPHWAEGVSVILSELYCEGVRP